MITFAVAMCAMIVGAASYASGQAPLGSPKARAETTGSCSPITETNSGSITIKCDGFSKEQNAKIIGLLKQLSVAQSNERDVLLAKMAEILDELRRTQHLVRPRLIPEESKLQIYASAWGRCLPERIEIVAPSGDPEAQQFAASIQGVLNNVGMRASVRYESMTDYANNTEDMKIVTSDGLHTCSISLFAKSLNRVFAIGDEQHHGALGSDYTHPSLTTIYVYPKLQ